MGNVVPLTVKPGSQSPGKELGCVFQAVGGIPFQGAEPVGVSKEIEHKG